jgi:KDO2-lipid IV(A) lauroyltransferase
MLAELKAGRGVVIALPHMGNFEQAGVWVIASGAGKLTTVAERLKPESVYQSFVRFRQTLGFEVLPLTGGAGPFVTLAARLRAGRLVCLVSDRDLKENGIEVELLGEKARIAAAAALAVHTGAALLPTATWFDEDGWGARIYDEVPVPASGTRAEKVAAMSQQLANVFSEAIAEHPQDWHMLQRVFLADLDPARLSKHNKHPERSVAGALGQVPPAPGSGT